MFNKDSVETTQNAETIIGPSIKVKGNFHGEGNIIIEGSLEGEISTKQSISVGNKAKIIANISANDAKIAGSVTGDLKIKGYLEILSSAIIHGNIQAQQISIEKKAIINGNISMQPPIDTTNSKNKK